MVDRSKTYNAIVVLGVLALHSFMARSVDEKVIESSTPVPTRLHVLPNPVDTERSWLVLEMTDQEAFDWDRIRYGELIALANLEDLQRPQVLGAMPGAEN